MMILDPLLSCGGVVLLQLLLLASAAAAADGQDDTFSCGGFLRSKVPIPFEKIKIKLLTSSGNLKAETDGIPDFGYYLLPVYEKGIYQLRVEAPNGWTFEPPAVDINLNGEDLCSQNRDINFEFRGFSIMGKVVSKGTTDGPSGVDVTLVDVGSTRTLKTMEGGNFVFPAVFPGVYKIQFRGEIVEVKVENDTLHLNDSLFVIEGYALNGKIKCDLPKATASVVLANQENVPCCGRSTSTELPEGFALPANHYVSCVVKASPDGSYTFPCVKAAANYVVFPHVVTQAGQMVEISPSKVEFELAHTDTSLASFEVTGFPVSGRVKEAGRNVEISIVETGNVAYTQDDGSFQLGSLRSGTYNLQFKKMGLYFKDKQVVIDAGSTTLPDIYPDKWELCGDVRVGESVEIEITNSLTNEVVKARSDVSSGRFCALLDRGEHIVRPKHSIRLSPWELTIRIPLASRQRVVFSQFSAVVRGKIDCLGNVCAGVKVSLSGASSAKTVANSDGTFSFDKKIDPGAYEVCVSHLRACFEKDCQPITVIDSNIDNVHFAQKGYLLRLDSSHETDVQIADKVIKLKAGLSTHCIAETKAVPIKPVGCHRFAKQDKLAFSPSSTDTVLLMAESHRLKVEINSKLLVDDLRLTVAKGENVQLFDLKEHKKSADTLFVYFAQLHYPKGVELVLEPHSGSLVFNPPKLTIRMPDDCVAVAVSARTGIFIEGRVTPPLADVEIRVLTAEASKAFETSTDADGRYRAGPLESQEYSIEARKDGYGFERIANSNDLAAVKYSRIDIKVVDDNTNAPLAGALVMIAGAQEYRNVTKTAELGDLSLIKLNPGDYYVRVVMKEYKFDPLSTMVSVSENSEELLLIKGKKIAYSVMGKVTSITGEVEVGVTLEAVSEQCDRHEEDATSDDTGYFRIRGLKKSCSYEIRLKKIKDGVETKFERTLPTTQHVTIEQSDVTLNLIVLRPIRSTTVSVAVRAEPELLSTLHVVLSNRNRRLYNLPAARFVTFPADLPLDGSAYQVEVQQHNSKLAAHFRVALLSDLRNVTDSSALTVFADRSYHHLEFEISVDEKAAAGHGQPAAPASPFVAVLSVFVALAFFYRKEISNLLRHRQDHSPAAGDRRKNRSR